MDTPLEMSLWAEFSKFLQEMKATRHGQMFQKLKDKRSLKEFEKFGRDYFPDDPLFTSSLIKKMLKGYGSKDESADLCLPQELTAGQRDFSKLLFSSDELKYFFETKQKSSVLFLPSSRHVVEKIANRSAGTEGPAPGSPLTTTTATGFTDGSSAASSFFICRAYQSQPTMSSLSVAWVWEYVPRKWAFRWASCPNDWLLSVPAWLDESVREALDALECRITGDQQRLCYRQGSAR